MSLSVNPKYEAFGDEENRKSSFKDFPKDRNINTEKLAIGGFFYVGSPAINGDMCKCYFCGLSLHKWEPEDDPWVEHHKHGQNCVFHLSMQDRVSNSSQHLHHNSNSIQSYNNPMQNYVQPPLGPVGERSFSSHNPLAQGRPVGYNYYNHPESQPEYNLSVLNANTLLIPLPSPHSSHLQTNKHSTQLSPHAGASIDTMLPPQTHYETSSQPVSTSNWKAGEILKSSLFNKHNPPLHNPIQPPMYMSPQSNIDIPSNSINIPPIAPQPVIQDQRYNSAIRPLNGNFGVPEMRTHSTVIPNLCPTPQQIPPRLYNQQKTNSAPHYTPGNQLTQSSLLPIMTNAAVVSIPIYQTSMPQLQVRQQLPSRIPSQLSSQDPAQFPAQIPAQIQSQILVQAPTQFHEPSQVPLPASFRRQTEPQKHNSSLYPQSHGSDKY